MDEDGVLGAVADDLAAITMNEEPRPPPVMPADLAEVIGAGLIQWMPRMTLEELDRLVVEPIIPGVNDLMYDEVHNDILPTEDPAPGNDGNDGQALPSANGKERKKKTTRVRRSRGRRGAQEIVKAVKSALSKIASLWRVVDKATYSEECFKSACVLPRDVEYLRNRDSFEKVMALAQEKARTASMTRWTPLIPVADIDPSFEQRRVEYIATCCTRAKELGKAFCQRRGHNISGQVVNHENYKSKIAGYDRKRSVGSVIDEGKPAGATIDATTVKMMKIKAVSKDDVERLPGRGTLWSKQGCSTTRRS